MPPILSLLVLDDRLRSWRFAAAVLLFTLIIAIGSIPGARADIAQLAYCASNELKYYLSGTL